MECVGQKVHLAIHARSGICIARMQIGTNQVYKYIPSVSSYTFGQSILGNKGKRAKGQFGNWAKGQKTKGKFGR